MRSKMVMLVTRCWWGDNFSAKLRQCSAENLTSDSNVSDIWHRIQMYQIKLPSNSLLSGPQIVQSCSNSVIMQLSKNYHKINEKINIDICTSRYEPKIYILHIMMGCCIFSSTLGLSFPKVKCSRQNCRLSICSYFGCVLQILRIWDEQACLKCSPKEEKGCIVRKIALKVLGSLGKVNSLWSLLTL